jgi:hypothetical protein
MEYRNDDEKEEALLTAGNIYCLFRIIYAPGVRVGAFCFAVTARSLAWVGLLGRVDYI